ncbi:hypothetical protein LR68_04117 [Anoxybacillus sp. BCO1]|nr:hypothetical protein LR68_04117 [Anoxybacillus sp. BCO1]
MSFDGVFTYAMTKELQRTLVGGAFQKFISHFHPN